MAPNVNAVFGADLENTQFLRYVHNWVMRTNRVKELRRTRGWTVRHLAEQAGLSHSYLVRIESGDRGLSVEVAEKLANAMETTVAQVLGVDADASPAIASFAEEAELYEAGPGDPVRVATKSRDNVISYRITAPALDAINIRIGDIVFVDISQAAVEELKPLDAVIVQSYSGMTATTLLRQYVPPCLLITNSTTTNSMPLRIDGDDVAIKGVIVGTFSRMRG